MALIDEKTLMEEEKKKKKKNRLLIPIFIIVNVAVIAVTAYNEFGKKSAEEFSFEFGPMSLLFLLLALLCLLLTLVIETCKYMLMMKGLGVKVSLRVAFQTAVFGKYFDNVTPSGVGGQPFQIYYMHKAGYSQGASTAMPLTQFMTMQIGFVILSFSLFLLRGRAISEAPLKAVAYIGLLFYLAMPLTIIIFTISRKAGIKLVTGVIKLCALLKIVKNAEERIEAITKSMEEYCDSMVLIGKHKYVLPVAFFLSLLYQLCYFSIPFFVLLAFNGTAGYLDIITMVAYVYCSSTLVPTPGNAGAAEGAFYIVFSMLGSSGVFWSMLIWRFISYYTVIIIGGITFGVIALENRFKNKKIKQ